HLHMPDMFEIWFFDEKGTAADDAHMSIGGAVKIEGGKSGDTTGTSLIIGEITSIEAICENMTVLTVVRGYERLHRMQRARRSQVFVNMKDSDIARKIATNAGLSVGTIDKTSVTHDHISQVAQTDLEFLTERAREIGFEVGCTQGKFYFRTASGMPKGGALGALASAASAVAGALGMGGALKFKDNLLSFYPRISAANITPDVEVRFWDGKGARVVSSNQDAKTGTAKLDDEPADLADEFTGGLLSLPSLPSLPKIPGLPMPDFGSTPSKTAFVVVNHPLANGSGADSAADEMAKGLADHISSTFAEAEGEAVGDPSIQAGGEVDIQGVPDLFKGKWTVTQARHIFDPDEMGYRVHFTVSGRSNRSLFALTSGGGHSHRPSFEGLVCGVVTDVKDPAKQGKVKVALPWLSPSFVTDWARVVHIAAGSRTGAMFLPEVSDEVLVGFEFGDPRRPYVIGGLINDNSKFSTQSSAVSGGDVVGRGFATPAGNQLLFTDQLPPGPPGPPPTKSEITLGTGDGNLALSIDQVGGTVTLTCKPAPPKSRTPAGTLTIDCSGAGKIAIKGGAGGVKIESDGQLELSGKAGVKIDSTALVQIKGQMVQLN
ncbi:MAG: hypothetical protein QOI15_43, partial [Pseudonocardiales bacterium]|nr:hypothetical protein [Pseudonocardiales bacterium]